MCHYLRIVWCSGRQHAMDWPALASPGFCESARRLDSEHALLAAWTRTCSARRLDTNLLCPLQLSSRTVEFPVSQFPWSRRSISSWGRSAIVLFLLSRRRDFTLHTPHTPDTSVAPAGGELTIDAFPPVQVLWMCCWAGAMGVILRVVDSTIVETIQKSLLSWFPGVQTDLVSCTSRLRVEAHGSLHILMVQ